MEGPTSEVFRRNGIAAQSSEGANCFSLVLASAAEAGSGGGGKRTLDLQVRMHPPPSPPTAASPSVPSAPPACRACLACPSSSSLPSVPRLLSLSSVPKMPSPILMPTLITAPPSLPPSLPPSRRYLDPISTHLLSRQANSHDEVSVWTRYFRQVVERGQLEAHARRVAMRAQPRERFLEMASQVPLPPFTFPPPTAHTRHVPYAIASTASPPPTHPRRTHDTTRAFALTAIPRARVPPLTSFSSHSHHMRLTTPHHASPPLSLLTLTPPLPTTFIAGVAARDPSALGDGALLEAHAHALVGGRALRAARAALAARHRRRGRMRRHRRRRRQGVRAGDGGDDDGRPARGAQLVRQPAAGRLCARRAEPIHRRGVADAGDDDAQRASARRALRA